MGWTFIPGRNMNELMETIKANIEGQGHELLASFYSGKDRVFWTVQKYKDEKYRTHRLIVAYLFTKNGKDWGYKAISETEHPYYYSCPIEFLKMTEEKYRHQGFSDNLNSSRWRIMVRSENHTTI